MVLLLVLDLLLVFSLGGALTSYVSWRAGFLIKLPIIIYLMWLTHHAVAAGIKQKATIDYIGSILSVLGLSSFIYGLTSDFYGGPLFRVVLYYLYSFTFMKEDSRPPLCL